MYSLINKTKNDIQNYFYKSIYQIYQTFLRITWWNNISILKSHLRGIGSNIGYKPAIGLENLGNTCYLNSILQALASLPLVINYLEMIISFESHENNNNGNNNNNNNTNSGSKKLKLNFSRMLLKIFKELRSKDGWSSIISAKDIYVRITSYRKSLGDFEQQDVGECFQALIGLLSLEEKTLLRYLNSFHNSSDLSLSDSSSKVPLFPFNGLISSVVTCHKCNYSRPPRIQTFTELSLPIEAPLSKPVKLNFFPSPTPSFALNNQMYQLKKLSDCLGCFSAGEILNEVECLNCSYETQVDSLRILLSSSWATQTENKNSSNEISEKLKQLEMNHFDEKKLEELILETDRERTTSTKQLLVSKYPQILCFQLMRNLYDTKTHRMKKLCHHVSFPIEIEESNLCIGLDYRVNLSPNTFKNKKLSSSKSSTENHIKQNGHVKVENKLNNENMNDETISSRTSSFSDTDSNGNTENIYQLKAVIVHHGGPDSGHYTTFAQVNDLNDIKARKWVHFSDEFVREVDERDVLGCEAYLLFYHKKL